MLPVSTRQYWVLYEYGHGGLWAVVRAESAAQIIERYPQLRVFNAPPADLDDQSVERIRSAGILDITEPPTGWMKDLVE